MPLGQTVEQRGPRRRQAVVLAARCARPGARLAIEGAGDDTGDAVLALKQTPGQLTGRIQLGERDGVLVSGDLKDAVGGGVQDPPTGAPMLLAVAVQYPGSGGRDVPQYPSAREPGKLIDHDHRRESLGIGRKRLRQGEPADLPMPGRAVLARAHRLADPIRRGRSRDRRHAGDGAHRPSPRAASLGNARRGLSSDVAQGVAAGDPHRRRCPSPARSPGRRAR